MCRFSKLPDPELTARCQQIAAETHQDPLPVHRMTDPSAHPAVIRSHGNAVVVVPLGYPAEWVDAALGVLLQEHHESVANERRSLWLWGLAAATVATFVVVQYLPTFAVAGDIWVAASTLMLLLAGWRAHQAHLAALRLADGEVAALFGVEAVSEVLSAAPTPTPLERWWAVSDASCPFERPRRRLVALQGHQPDSVAA